MIRWRFRPRSSERQTYPARPLGDPSSYSFEPLEQRALLSGHAALPSSVPLPVDAAMAAPALVRSTHDGDAAQDHLEDNDEPTAPDKPPLGSHASPAPAIVTKRMAPNDSAERPTVAAWLKQVQISATSLAVDAMAVAVVPIAPRADGFRAADDSSPLGDGVTVLNLRTPIAEDVQNSFASLDFSGAIPATAIPAQISVQSLAADVALAHFASVDAAGTFGDSLSRFIDECTHVGSVAGLAGPVGKHARAWATTALITTLDAAVAFELIRRARRKRRIFAASSQ